MPVLGARNEFNAINRLHQLGISTMETFAFGETGLNPLRRKSFIITKDLNPAISLEDYCSNWKNDPPPYFVKKSIILEVARMIRLMHEGELIIAIAISVTFFYISHIIQSPNQHFP